MGLLSPLGMASYYYPESVLQPGCKLQPAAHKQPCVLSWAQAKAVHGEP